MLNNHQLHRNDHQEAPPLTRLEFSEGASGRPYFVSSGIFGGLTEMGHTSQLYVDYCRFLR